MSTAMVPLTALSFSKEIGPIPVVERTLITFEEAMEFQVIWTLEWCWGVDRGGIHLKIPLNRMELRADMAKSFDDEDWTLMPTRETLRGMSHLLQHNARADAHSRRNAIEECRPKECEYELKFVGYREPGEEPTIYAPIGDAEPRAFEFPYTDLRIRSCAHPFYVVYRAHLLVTVRHHSWNDKTLPSLNENTMKISKRWRKTPPTEFRYGPDFPLEHCHPGSIAGSVNGSSHSTSSLRKRKRTAGGTDVNFEASSRLCARTLGLSSLGSLYADRTAVVSWLDMLEPGDIDCRCTPESALTDYTQEPSRDPREVMRTGWCPFKISRPLGQERDMSRWTSSIAAAWIAGVIIWGRHDDGSS
ncbi:hypothetical protein K525DRAFT_208222 [Schizophyllum commune Loenen D]|nr:hypothetical protein K525DRAFT_208222 [Schizophyllum commune Loenen D]